MVYDLIDKTNLVTENLNDYAKDSPVPKSAKDVSDKYNFISLDFVEFIWEIIANGQKTQEGKLENIKIGPGEQKEEKIPFKELQIIPNTEYHLSNSD